MANVAAKAIIFFMFIIFLSAFTKLLYNRLPLGNQHKRNPPSVSTMGP